MGWTVYSVTHRATGRQYIGVTCRPVSRRWDQHRSDARKGRGWLLAKAIREHGAEAFDFAVIVSHLNEAAGKETECRLIALLEPAFNITPGGDAMPVMTPEQRAAKSASMMGKSLNPVGHQVTLATREKIAAALRGRKASEETRAKLRGRVPHNRGVPVSAETRSKISRAKKGVKPTAEALAARALGLKAFYATQQGHEQQRAAAHARWSRR